MATEFEQETGDGIAIIGMSGRFPGASNVPDFWNNICAGRETITRFSRDELEINPFDDAGAPEADSYVCAKGMLENVDLFDAGFFDYLPRVAELIDPQHRIFLEICSEAIEVAGHDPERFAGAIGVFAGCYMDTYILNNLCADEAFRSRLVNTIQVGSLQTEMGNDKDYLATRVAYKLGLRGPAMTLQSACSTSLVASVTACESLNAGQCDMALAGGVTLVLPQMKGYFHTEGSIHSPDGHCRPFDERAAGTIFGNGAAVLLLKRVEDALQDGDTIYGVIKGYALNNDGNRKSTFTAPSPEGQSKVISRALSRGRIDASTIGYVEAHGTATPLGDPIEIAGLTSAYRAHTDKKQYCAIGSVKGNVGHLDCASGAIGLIKTAMSLHNKVIPPSINYRAPNPDIDFASSPFYVNTKLAAWKQASYPRRAGVSSYGIGGTNAHVVVEEAPTSDEAPVVRSACLLPLSAKTETALKRQAGQLADYLAIESESDLGAVAFTLQNGRRQFNFRHTVTAGTRREAIDALQRFAAGGEARKIAGPPPRLTLMFPGQGAQYPGMARQLYEDEPVYRDTIDAVCDALAEDENGGLDLRALLLWREGDALSEDEAAAALAQTRTTQPALFAVELAMARLLESWGIVPDSLVGHSVGEFAAACHAGVYSLPDAARLTALRGRLVQAMPPGSMLAAILPEDEMRILLPPRLDIAAINAPNACVVAGATADVDAFAEQLAAKGHKSKKLQTSHAFHSHLMQGAVDELREAAEALPRHPPRFELFSSVTGGRIDGGQFALPAYWAEQLTAPVRFSGALEQALASDAPQLLIETGPGRALSAFAQQIAAGRPHKFIACAMRSASAPGADYAAALQMIGGLWQQGFPIDWRKIGNGAARRIALPTYPFERKRFWIDPPQSRRTVAPVTVSPETPTAANGGPPSLSATSRTSHAEHLVRRQLQIMAAQMKAMRGE